jgi:hypothetical protein
MIHDLTEYVKPNLTKMVIFRAINNTKTFYLYVSYKRLLMATCAELDRQAQQTATQLAQAIIRGDNLLKLPIPNTRNPSETPAIQTQITGLNNSINLVNAEINRLLNQLNSIKSQQSQQNCVVTGYAPTIRAANNTLNALQNKSQVAQQTFQNLPPPPASNTTIVPNNNTLLTPGTQAQDDLPEITVVGTKIPDGKITVADPNLITPSLDPALLGPPNINTGQLEGTDVNIPTNAGNIDVTAPNLNLGEITPGEDENLEEVTITAQRNPAELEEFTVTGRRVPTTQGAVQNTRKQASLRQETDFPARDDWRVKLSLSPGATYLYNDDSNVLLQPLKETKGVIFPYTPSVQVGYSASYGNYRPSGSNYAYPYYDSSAIDSISITGDFTAQDNFEANYLLAVIHFLRSVTKMFYALDSNPKAGTPPPVLFLTGFGQFMFNNHPLVITNFTYTTPTDVDYIRAGALGTAAGQSQTNEAPKKSMNWNWGTLLQNTIQNTLSSGAAAIGNFLNFNKDYNVLTPGGELGQANWTYSGFKGFNAAETTNPTYVPTRMQIQLSAMPVLSRLDVSNYFSLKDYANGKLLSGYNGKGKGAGFW